MKLNPASTNQAARANRRTGGSPNFAWLLALWVALGWSTALPAQVTNAPPAAPSATLDYNAPWRGDKPNDAGWPGDKQKTTLNGTNTLYGGPPHFATWPTPPPPAIVMPPAVP